MQSRNINTDTSHLTQHHQSSGSFSSANSPNFTTQQQGADTEEHHIPGLAVCQSSHLAISHTP
eukprot:1156445-Pelagomonas_calceolata.AAC.4